MQKRCSYCKGQGTLPGSDPSAPRTTCPVCNRRGHNLVPADAGHCGYCGGTGRVPTGDGGLKMCPDCKGIGWAW